MPNPERLRMMAVEANEDDIAVLKRTIRSCRLNCELYFARDGEEALDALARNAGSEIVPSPDLILINPNLPKIDGFEVLCKIKQDTRLRRIPVVILTASEREEDMVRAYDCGAASYRVKPMDPEQLNELAGTVSAYWRFVRGQSDSEAEREIR